MGQALVARYRSARETMAEADDVLGFSLSKLCFEGPEDVLTDTINAQPALLATSMAALRSLQEALPILPPPGAAAGHSLGEYTALVAAGSLSFADGLRLVRERGRLMKEAGEQNPGGMAAILALDSETVSGICDAVRTDTGGVIQVANDNCPGQLVISGDEQALELAMQRAEQAGARKVVRLAVSIAAHSPLMEPAAVALRRAIDDTAIKASTLPIIGNVSAHPLNTVAQIRHELAAQLTSPVRWTESMRHLVEQGIDRVIEIGPGNVLTTLMKRIDRQVGRHNIGDPDGIANLLGNAG